MTASVHPAPWPTPADRRRQPITPVPRMIADAMLGALARWLRVLDFDVLYDPELDDPDLVDRAVAEGRVILTRDRLRPDLLARHPRAADAAAAGTNGVGRK